MKQIIYLFIGFFITLSFINYGYAECRLISCSPELEPNASYDFIFVGHFNTVAELESAIYSSSPGGWSWLSLNDTTVHTPICTPDFIYKRYYRIATTGTPKPYVYGYIYVDFCPPDSDGDGLNDDCDEYPEDNTPYSVKLFAFQTIDGTPDGDHVREIYITDRGDYISLGSDYDDTKPESLIFNGTWIDPSVLCGTGTQTSIDDYKITQLPYTTGPVTGDAEPGKGTGFEDADEPIGGENDSELLNQIARNTAKDVQNSKRQGDYLHELNESIKNMDRNISILTQGGDLAGDGNDNEIEIPDTDQSQKDPLENLDVASTYGSVTGELVEGADYDSPGELVDESFMTDFFASNPLVQAFDNSGFSASSSVSKMTLDLGAMGTHDLDLSQFESGFIAFGNLLFAFCGLSSLFIITRG